MIKIRQIESDMTMPQYIRYLRRLGIKQKASGAYAKVYTHTRYSTTRVVKVVGEEDTGYLYHLDFCLANQHNVMVPKIYNVTQVLNPRADYYIVCMEKLEPISPRVFYDSIYLDALYTLNPENPPRFNGAIPSQHFNAMQRHLVTGMEIGFELDLHSENTMMREYGAWVVTDPFDKWN